MTSPITSLFGGSPSLDKATLEKTKRQALERPADGQSESGRPAAAKPAPRGDELQLSPIAKRAMAEPAFDREKVEAIKQALREGTYPMDARRIAESFASMERLIG